jgi:hypothetical protein
MKVFWIAPRWMVAASLAWPMGTLHAAQEATRVQPQATAEDVLASLSIGSNYVLRMAASTWQQAPPFTLHQRSVTFLKPADAAGFSGPVEGEADIPGLDLGVMSVDALNQVDLSRLERLVTRKTIRSVAMLPPADPSRTPSVTDVDTKQGEDTLVSGSSDGRMPELRNPTVPFLALVRDVAVLSGAENLQPNRLKSAAASTPAK